MNNTEGERCQKTQEFCQMLERRTGLEVILWDERLTTVAAQQIMKDSNVRLSEREKFVDSIAAGLILQGYLDFINSKQDKLTKPACVCDTTMEDSSDA